MVDYWLLAKYIIVLFDFSHNRYYVKLHIKNNRF